MLADKGFGLYRVPKPKLRFYLIPAIIILSSWLMYMIATGQWYVFVNYYVMSITMVFGSLVAGATSEGGGAVAFPVFTKVLKLAPEGARVFALAIQSMGMTSAALTIIKNRIPVVKESLIYSSLGGAIGIIIGTLFIVQHLIPSYTKILFTLLVTGFGFVLLIEQFGLEGRLNKIDNFDTRKALILVTAGIIGGFFSSAVGSGLDIVTFSILVMYFNISEKVATPTSVILMALNSWIGFTLHVFVTGGFNIVVRDWWLACVPIVIFGAPIGSLIAAKISRKAIVYFLLTLIFIEFVSTILIVKFDTLSLIASPIILVLTIAFFWYLRTKRMKEMANKPLSP